MSTPAPDRPIFEELDRIDTRMGELVLRRRIEPVLQVDLYEVKLGDEFLMSSLFTVAERALATLGLAACPSGAEALDVVVGGLGLGYTAVTVLADPRVRAVQVVDALAPVIRWHRDGLLPDAVALTVDDRCSLLHGDFFAWAAGDDIGLPKNTYDAVLVDIDHTPRHHLDPTHAALYEPGGLRRLARRVRPGGVFGLWSDEAPDETFLAAARSVFTSCEAHVVTFRNPITGGHASNTVYVATRTIGMQPTAALDRALDQILRVADSIDDTDLVKPTPCADFDVRALLNHTAASLQGLAAAASGEAWDLSAYGRDVLGSDPTATFRQGVEQLRTATRSEDVLDRDWVMPFGPTPGSQAIAIAIMELTQHAWDLARAGGSDVELDEELAEHALELAYANLPPDDQRPPAAFGPSVPVPADAPTSDRLAGFTGRAV